MDHELAALRALVLDDRELVTICAELLTVLKHGEPLVETLEFNVVGVTVDRTAQFVEFQGALSVNDDAVRLSERRFVEVASTIAEPLSGERLVDWQKHRQRRVWRMPPGVG
jgi:hypothetical protein